MSSLGGDLSVRERPSGGEVAAGVRENPPGWTLLYGRVVIFVHGYNNSLRAACKSYAKLRRLMPSRFPRVGHFFWPGDLSNGLLSKLSFPAQIAGAREAGEKLAEFLQGVERLRRTPLEIVLVGHSLGCRVILEMLRDVVDPGRAPWPRVPVVCLMAAAVPTGHVRPDGRLEDAIGIGKERLVLFSPDDGVLRWTFPIGQFFAEGRAGADGLLPEAVGRHGNPKSYPTQSYEMSGNGHGDYWSDDRVIDCLAPLVGVATPRRIDARRIVGREMPPPIEELIRRAPERRVGTAWRSECEGAG
ncbi:MAG: alpha/beta fold hydrolase [Candidatus Eisenbacteria bacterium]|nr:alpha/beta fold hydrolase [Candidatus Eisenbacteria bacterium]